VQIAITEQPDLSGGRYGPVWMPMATTSSRSAGPTGRVPCDGTRRPSARPIGSRGIDGVVNLAGAGIADRPHTAGRRRQLRDSRLQATSLLAETLAALDRPPSVLLSASAMGFYGDRGDAVLPETADPGDDFLAGLCRDWEAATGPAEEAGIRTAHLRTSIVLDAHGGALAKQLPLFKVGLGARAGKGEQWMPWITLDDHVSAMVHLLTHDVSGPVNLSTPEPVTNRAFTEAVAAHVGRPTFLSIPRVTARLPFGIGGLVQALLFTSVRMEPTVLVGSGFAFGHATLDDALTAVVGR
jgi:uncharacterized protein (TIGR01777 family)